MRNAARAIPQVWSKTFQDGIVLLEILQAVRDLATVVHEDRHAMRQCEKRYSNSDVRRFGVRAKRQNHRH
jgi:hypothetical protein